MFRSKKKIEIRNSMNDKKHLPLSQQTENTFLRLSRKRQKILA